MFQYYFELTACEKEVRMS